MILDSRKTKKMLKEYKPCSIEEVAGKTVAFVGETKVEGPYGKEPCTVLFFSDGTQHGFVIPTDDDD